MEHPSVQWGSPSELLIVLLLMPLLLQILLPVDGNAIVDTHGGTCILHGIMLARLDLLTQNGLCQAF